MKRLFGKGLALCAMLALTSACSIGGLGDINAPDQGLSKTTKKLESTQDDGSQSTNREVAGGCTDAQIAMGCYKQLLGDGANSICICDVTQGDDSGARKASTSGTTSDSSGTNREVAGGCTDAQIAMGCYKQLLGDGANSICICDVTQGDDSGARQAASGSSTGSGSTGDQRPVAEGCTDAQLAAGCYKQLLGGAQAICICDVGPSGENSPI